MVRRGAPSTRSMVFELDEPVWIRVIILKARTPTPQAAYHTPAQAVDLVTPQGDISPPRSDVGAAIQGSDL